MKKLNELVNTTLDIDIESIEEDSRIQGKNILFCAIKGIKSDGHSFINNAKENGAVAALVEDDVNTDIPTIKVDSVPYSMNKALDNFYDNPTNKMKLVGITGTDGKTTTATVLYQLMNKYKKCGIIGTEVVKCPGYSKDQIVTTPFPKDLFYIFNEFVNHGCEVMTMECSSERLGTKRLDGIDYDISIFTNIDSDHLDTHKTFENYLAAKQRLFEHTKKDGVCIINNDDLHAKDIIEKCNGKVITYAIDNDADVKATDVNVQLDHLTFKITGLLGEHEIYSPLTGKFNAYNLMADLIALYSLGIDIDEAIKDIKYLQRVPGRQETVDLGQPFKIFVDFTVTAHAWKNLYSFVKPLTTGKVIAVLGTKGNRFIGRRIDLGRTVCENADHVIFTTGNPKMEDPLKIITEGMLKEVKTDNYEIILDREEAIKKAVEMAKPGDTILITGKGVEHHQEVMGKCVPYDGDLEIASKYVQKLMQKN